MQIGGVQKTSLLDFPDKISAIVFTQGCNFRCGYCHNPELIVLRNEPAWTTAGFFEFLETRKGKLDGVVITGGEPSLQNDLIDFIKDVKSMGFLVKLDTNGTFPDKLQKSLPYIDYIAMDIKAPLYKYSEITRVNVNCENIQKSIDIIMNCGIDYEFRTTVLKSQLTFGDFEKIGQLIKGAKKYYLQKFVASKTLDESLMNEITYSNEEFEEIISLLNLNINNLFLWV